MSKKEKNEPSEFDIKWEKFCDWCFDIVPCWLYSLYKDWLTYSSWHRRIKFFYQRCRYGFDDSETWNLDSTFYSWFLPRLKRFREVTCAYPSKFNSIDEWYAELDHNIELLEFLNKEDSFSDKDWDKKQEEFMNWFSTTIQGLWW